MSEKYFLLLSFFLFSACAHTEMHDNHPVQNKPTNVLTLDKINDLIQDKKEVYENCTTKILQKQNKNLAKNTSLLIHLVISGNGAIASLTKEQANFKNPAVEKCYLDAIKSIQFPPTINGNDVDISYPFSFDYLFSSEN